MLKNRTPSALAWITTVQIFMLFAFCPIFGVMYDMHGRRMLLMSGFFVLGFLAIHCLMKYYWEVLIDRSGLEWLLPAYTFHQ